MHVSGRLTHWWVRCRCLPQVWSFFGMQSDWKLYWMINCITFLLHLALSYMSALSLTSLHHLKCLWTSHWTPNLAGKVDLFIVRCSTKGHDGSPTSPAMALAVGCTVYAALSNPVAMETHPAYNSVHWNSKCIHASSSIYVHVHVKIFPPAWCGNWIQKCSDLHLNGVMLLSCCWSIQL